MNEDFETRLRENRYEPTGLELDELKRRAMAQAARGERARGRRSPRLVTSFLALALMLSGGSAVVASTSGGSSGQQPSASASQYQIVSPVRVGNARLIAPTGCVARAFNARVRGVEIVKVVFKIDGKKVKTLTKPNSGTNFQYRVNPKKFRIGVHRIVATVTFSKETNKKAQTFRISFQRCARKLAAPRFTG
jgi:hypothetical protein